MRATGRNGTLEATQREFVQLRTIEALLPREPAAEHVVDRDDFGTAATGNGHQLVHRAHLAHAAHRMHDDRVGATRDRDPRQHRVVKELDAVLDRKPPMAVALHPIGAWTRVEYDRP